MIRAALILAIATAGVTTVISHKRPGAHPAVTPTPRAALLHASRAERRPPLPRHPHRGFRARPHVVLGSGGHLHDVTMYCATGSRNAAGRWPRLGDVAVLDRSIPFGRRVLIAGNTYYVEDWIGSGSEFDIYGGNDAGCEQRALDFGRRHLRVVVG